MSSSVLPGTGNPPSPPFSEGGVIYLTGTVLIGGTYN